MAEVVTTGTGQVPRTADRAVLTVVFSAVAAERQQAIADLAARVSGLETTLGAEHVEVASRTLSVRPHVADGAPAGSRAVQHFMLRVGDPAALEQLAAELIDAEPERLDGPRWELSDPTEATDEAQRLAVHDARRRAESYADALGVRLGELVRLSDVGADRPRASGPAAPQLGGASRGTAAHVRELDLTPGEVTVTVVCNATWNLA
ncbi:SIMPL domain-containing protein [Saccharopolyspora cebuensis]|uniref:SIMPL domain-containing protein n=1 Tax=Saccharopolyspora cebuensis TaxID=418759 RepID=A0ABV4CKT3_9PSEU